MHTAKQVAEELEVPVGTLAYWRMLGKGPEYRKIGRWVRYARSDIEEFKANPDLFMTQEAS